MYTKFIYPEYKSATHVIKNMTGLSSEYPNSNIFNDSISYDYNQGIDVGTRVCVIRENVGFECKWSYVRIIDNVDAIDEYNEPLEFYILNNNLENIGGKSTYEPICTPDNDIDVTAPEIVPYLKEVFLPYMDKRNGLYSVRISVDYEKILDMRLFNKVLEEVYLEGINILLASRGYLSDNKTILDLKNKYYTFAFIHKDFDVTLRRPCEPLTFTVSIPLNFFNQAQRLSEGSPSKKAVNIIRFTNFDFINKVDNIIDILTNKVDQLEKALYPNKVLENFVIDFELNSLRRFAVAVNELLQTAGFSFTSSERLITYEICLDINLELVGVTIISYDDNSKKTYYFPQSMLSQARLRGDFNNKRIFNYFLKYDEMYNSIETMDAIEFYKTYVSYPTVQVVGEKVTIKGITINEEQIKEFRMSFSKNSEKCIKLSDLQNLYSSGTESFQLFSDPIYHLFVANDPKNIQQQKSTVDQIKENMTSLVRPRDSIIEENGAPQFILGELSSSLNVASQSFLDSAIGDYTGPNLKSGIINGLGYFLKRINIQEIILRQIICYLKGLNQNDPEVAAILAQLPNQVLNYISYIETVVNGDLRGAAWLRALEQGITFDFELFCSDEFAYFLKGITAITNTINIGANTAITIVKEIDTALQSAGISKEYSAENPYAAIAKSIGKQIYTFIFDFIYDLLNTVSTPICDDPLYDKNIDNFEDPMNTHVPIRLGSQEENNNQDIINKNRSDAISDTFPEIFRQLQYGVDLEYTVDLLQLLINDIKCILTPTENVNLLKGNASEEVVILIKNIIRNKYSKDPNNLSYLLNEDKLKLFFKKLGDTVDQQKLESIVTAVTKITPANVCTPEQYQIRCELINNKLPPELNILQDDLRNRTQKVRELLDKLKSGEKIININALCPEIQDQDMLEMKTNLAKQYSDSIRSIFANVLNTFSREAADITNKISEERNLFRIKDTRIFDQYIYYTYFSTLSKNMNNLKFDSTSQEYKANKSSIIKYQQLNVDVLEEWQYQDIFFETSYLKAEIPKDCDKPASYRTDERFIKFLSEGRVIWENRPWTRKWDNIGKKWKNRGSKGTWASQFVQEIYEQSPELYEYIKQKKYVLFISSETTSQYNPSVDEADSSKEVYQKALYRNLIDGESEEKIYFRFLYYTKAEGLEDNAVQELGDFRMLYEAELSTISELSQSEVNELNKQIRINLGNFTGEIISNLQYDRRNEEKFENISYIEFYEKYYPNIKKFFRIEDVPDNRRYGAHILNSDIIKITDIQSIKNGANFEYRSGVYAPIGYTNQDTTLNIIQQIFTKNFESSVGAIQTFEKFYQSKNKFDNKGLFNITTVQDDGNKESVRMIMLPTSTGVEDNPIDYKVFYNIRQTNDIYSEAVMNSVNFELFYKSLYSSIDKFYLDQYYKKYLDRMELSFLKKDGTTEQYDFTNYLLGQDEDAAFYADLANEGLSVVKNKDYKDKQAKNITRLNYFDLSTDIRYQKCNIFPHYLNLEYLLKLARDDYKSSICDTNLDTLPDNLLKEIIIIITIRAHITDLMIKSVPFLSLLDKEELYNFHKDKFVIDTLREHIKNEMNIFHQNYFDSFLQEINNLYTLSEYSEKLDKSKFLNYSSQQNKILEYFISKEIYRFINFSLEKDIFKAQTISVYRDKEFLEKYIISSAYDIYGSNTDSESLRAFLKLLTPKQIRSEFYTILIYILMANTIDSKKRSIFIGTKQELASIFFSNINRTSEETVYEEKSQEDIVKFINNLSKASDPSVMVYLNPDYCKYIDFAVSAIRTQTKQSLLINAVYTEPNIALTRVINRSLAAAGIAAWSLIPQENREELMLKASVDNIPASLLYDRLNKGMGPIPQPLISVMSLGAGLPGFYGIPYLALDAWDEYDWFNSAMRNIEQLRDQALNGKDPCETTEINTQLSCKDNKNKLLEELDKYEK